MKFKNIFNSQAKNSFKKKVISTVLIAGVITSSTSSFAGVLSEDLRFETFNDNNVAITNILEDSNENLKIEGETLVNLADIDSDYEIRNKSSIYTNFTICETSKLKLNTDYTFIIEKELLDNHNNNFNTFEIGLSDILNSTNNHPNFSAANNAHASRTITYDMSKKTEVLRIKIRFTDFKGYKYLSARPIRRLTDAVSGEYANANIKLTLLEGDYTHKDIPYFKGIKSSFEDNLVTQEMVDSGLEDKKNLGKYKAEIEVTEKNLFDINKPFNIPYGTLVSGRDVVNVDGVLKTNALTGIISSYSQKYNLLKNTYYTLSATAVNGDISFRIYDDSKYQNITEKIFKNGIRNSITFNTGDLSPEYLRIIFHRMQDVDSGIKDVQIEMSSTASEYQPYKKSVKTFYLDSPLHKGDSIENINGTVYHVKRHNIISLNGDESWEGDGVGDRTYAHLYALEVPDISGSNRFVISDKLQYLMLVPNGTDTNTISIFAENDGRKRLYIHMPHSVINSTGLDLVLFKKWLSDNPVKVIYEVAAPEYKVLDRDLNIQLTKGNTHISHNSKIPTNLNITVDRTANRAYEAIELAKTSPTVENLAQARMWINLLDDSTLKDDFQDTVNDITNITDMKLEKKKVSANIDLYVKSENSLSMSLSTNSITFDNYTGTENMEKLKAVEISINSSLPYDLNAYLETNFSNSDGSKSMDINTLKIKESSKSNYSSFTNLKQKLTLKEDCVSGNYIKHDIDLKLESDNAHQADVYKTTVKFEAIQK